MVLNVLVVKSLKMLEECVWPCELQKKKSGQRQKERKHVRKFTFIKFILILYLGGYFSLCVCLGNLILKQ